MNVYTHPERITVGDEADRDEASVRPDAEFAGA
jgi:hypothetical protein